MPGVIMGATFDLSGTHRQERLAAIERLDLAFLINAKHDRVLGGCDVKSDHIAHFLDEQRIGRKLECLRAMRLQTEGAPDALHARYRHARRPSHATRTPVRSTRRRTFKRLHDDRLDTIIRDRAWGAGPRLVVQAIHALRKKTATPFANRCRINPQPHRNILVPHTHAGGKHNAGSQRDPLGGLAPPRKPFQFSPFALTQNDRW